MAEWWEGFSLYDQGSAPIDFGDYNFGDFNFDLPQYDFSFPEYDFSFPDFNFDPGQFDLGFDPSFNFDNYFPDFQFSDPFALPTADLSLPNFDLGSFSQPFDLGSFSQDFNMGGFDPNAGFPSLMAGLPPDESAFQPNDWSSFMDPNDLSAAFGSNALSGGLGSNFRLGELDTSGFGGTGNFPGVDATKTSGATLPGQLGRSPSTNDALKNTQASYNKWAPYLGLGQLGLQLGGGLLGAFGPQPKPRPMNDLEKSRAQAEIDAIRAKIELDKEALRLQAEAAGRVGGGGGGPIDYSAVQREIAQLEADTQLKIAGMNKRVPLFGTDPRFSTLFNEVSADQNALTPDSPEIQTMTQQIYATRRQAASEDFARQREAILEQANRLGTNPAAQLAQINEAEQQANQALMVEAQQQALAFAQSRLDPATQLLDAILGTVV